MSIERGTDVSAKFEQRINLAVVYGIASRLEAQHPDWAPLTFAGDLKELRKQFPDVWQNVIPEDEA